MNDIIRLCSVSRIGWRDPHSWLALSLGPATWLLLAALLGPTADPPQPLVNPWVLVLPVVVHPLVEEILFRGYLQGWIAARSARTWGPVSQANLITSVLFATAHIVLNPGLMAALVFFPSLIFGYFRERHNGLATPILLHAWYNLGFVWIYW